MSHENLINMPKSFLDINDVERETMLSSGPGGQNVNKVESGVRLRFNITASQKFTDEQKSILLERLMSRLTEGGELLVQSTESRSQYDNTQIALKKLNEFISDALKPVKKRFKTKPTKASQEKRLESKRRQAEKKKQRQKFNIPPSH